MSRADAARTLAVATAVVLLSWGLAAPGLAETPSPSPGATAEPSVSPTPEPTPTPVRTPTPTAPAPTVASPARAADTGAALTLAVVALDGLVAGTFVEDLGSYGFSGTSGLPDGTRVEVERRTGTDTWDDVTTATLAGGAYAAAVPVREAGEATFRAVAAGAEGADVTSTPTTVTVQDATVALTAPGSLDSLQKLPVHGTVTPARAGVEVHVDLRRGSVWKNVAVATTAADGSWATTVAYGRGELRREELRATYRAVNRPRWERSATVRSTRVAVLDPVVEATTSADVAKTYRKGCPVGPSKLSTIHLNHYGRDKRMHRGVIIVRTDLQQEIVRAFGTALDHRYPVAKMKNPDDYGGNDPKQMAANNTSGFNCRKVVGNPYKMSPHSYGIAIDVNTVQNPYRDATGRWWPTNGKGYRDRTPLRWGMLGTGSPFTKSLRGDDFFWGGLWNPGRDYQHFEYRG